MGNFASTAAEAAGRFTPSDAFFLADAARTGNAEVVRLFLRKNPALVYATTADKSTPWHVASDAGHLFILDVLVEVTRANAVSNTFDPITKIINQQNAKGQTALMLACAGGHADCAAKLLSLGAHLLVADEGGLSALHYAALHSGKHVTGSNSKSGEAAGASAAAAAAAAKGGADDCVELLLAHMQRQLILQGPKVAPPEVHAGVIRKFVDTGDVYGRTALHYAAWSGNARAAHALWSAGADIAARTVLDCYNSELPCNSGTTPLHFAAMRGNQPVVVLLLAAWHRTVKQPGAALPRPPFLQRAAEEAAVEVAAAAAALVAEREAAAKGAAGGEAPKQNGTAAGAQGHAGGSGGGAAEGDGKVAEGGEVAAGGAVAAADKGTGSDGGSGSAAQPQGADGGAGGRHGEGAKVSEPNGVAASPSAGSGNCSDGGVESQSATPGSSPTQPGQPAVPGAEGECAGLEEAASSGGAGKGSAEGAPQGAGGQPAGPHDGPLAPSQPTPTQQQQQVVEAKQQAGGATSEPQAQEGLQQRPNGEQQQQQEAAPPGGTGECLMPDSAAAAAALIPPPPRQLQPVDDLRLMVDAYGNTPYSIACKRKADQDDGLMLIELLDPSTNFDAGEEDEEEAGEEGEARGGRRGADRRMNGGRRAAYGQRPYGVPDSDDEESDADGGEEDEEDEDGGGGAAGPLLLWEGVELVRDIAGDPHAFFRLAAHAPLLQPLPEEEAAPAGMGPMGTAGRGGRASMAAVGPAVRRESLFVAVGGLQRTNSGSSDDSGSAAGAPLLGGGGLGGRGRRGRGLSSTGAGLMGAGEGVEEEPVPDCFLCPMTCKIFRDPVVAADGVTYEREAIERHLRHVPTSPVTKQRMPTTQVFPNTALKRAIEHWTAFYGTGMGAGGGMGPGSSRSSSSTLLGLGGAVRR